MKTRSPMRRQLGLKALLGASAFALFAIPQVASAQLATQHYLPPVPSHADGDIEIQVWTPLPQDGGLDQVSYTIRSGRSDGNLTDAGMSIPMITGSVSAGAPDVFVFDRSGATDGVTGETNQDSSGGLSRYTVSHPPDTTIPRTGLNADDLRNNGLIVESTGGPVTVVMLALRGTGNRSIIAGKGDNALGTDFYAWSSYNNDTAAGAESSVANNNENVHFVSLMATEDGTEVEVTGAPSGFVGYTPGSTIFLDAYETFTFGTTANLTVTGTHIQSNRPITVTSGDVHAYQDTTGDGNAGNRDGTVDQLVPTRLAGTHYVLGNIADHTVYGRLGDDGLQVGNRYVQLVAIEDGTQVTHTNHLGATANYLLDAGEVAVITTAGTAGLGHYFESTGANVAPFLLYLNSAGQANNEMGGAAVPALRGELSEGAFCSGSKYVEFAAPANVQSFMVYIPTIILDSLEVNPNGTGFVDYTTLTLQGTTSIDPGAPGGGDEITFIRFPGNTVGAGQPISFRSSGRMHVSVGVGNGSTGAFGYFSDFNFGFQINDPVLNVPTDSYVEPQVIANKLPRTVNHCITIDSACSQRWSINSITSDRGGDIDNVTTTSTADFEKPCFDFTPVPVIGAGAQRYVVTAQVIDETNATRDVDIVFEFTWLDDEGDGIPDDLDLDDDNDGIIDVHELGGIDLSGDQDLDQISDFEDIDFVGPLATGAGTSPQTDCVDLAPVDGRCDSVPAAFDQDGDGIPNHQDLDSDGDGVWDLIEGDDANFDGLIDKGSISDADNDGIIDGVIDVNQNGVDDAYDAAPAARQNTDSDSTPDYLDRDDDGDGLFTDKENYNGGSPGDDNSDTDGRPDYLDPDDDGDGLFTRDESPDPNGDGDPSDAINTSGTGAPDYLDIATLGPPNADGDGQPDALDDDDDNDGIPDSVEGDGDDDGDGVPNRLDLDSDNDGIPDLYENGLGALDLNGDGRIDDLTDTDGDGIVDGAENPPADRDTDNDGTPDRLDLDSDEDGVPDVIEAGGVDAGGDGRLDSTTDANQNGLMDTADPAEGGNLPPIPDTDRDGDPDFQDIDDDNDGIWTLFEDLDKNGDHQNDDTDDDGIPNYLDPDDDGDGVLTVDENPDPNGDGDPSDALSTLGSDVPDYLNPDQTPLDTDGDGIPDDVECPDGAMPDTDDDGIPNCLDPDDDGDGVPTRDERPMGDQDTDGDGIPDHLDPDDDGDGIPTKDELGDADGDGIPDYLEGEPGAGPPETPSGDSAASLLGGGFGCSVGTPGPSPAAPWLILGLGLGLAELRRRKKAARRSPSC